MSRSFLARFRGADARSIAHAMALLLLFNAVFGAFHSSLMAEARAGELVLCSLEGAVPAGEGLPVQPAGADDLSCCVLGAGPAPAALAVEPATLPPPAFAVTAFAPPLLDRFARDPRHSGIAAPRGPPILA
jgi:hypothetical protein